MASSSPHFKDDDVIICSLHEALLHRVSDPSEFINTLCAHVLCTWPTQKDFPPGVSTTLEHVRRFYREHMSGKPQESSSMMTTTTDKNWWWWLRKKAWTTFSGTRHQPIAFAAFCKTTSSYVGSVCIDLTNDFAHHQCHASPCIARVHVTSAFQCRGITTALIKHAIDYARHTMYPKTLFIWATDYWTEQSYQTNIGFHTCFTRSTAEHPRMRLMALELRS